jgi:hypothetical protein
MVVRRGGPLFLLALAACANGGRGSPDAAGDAGPGDAGGPDARDAASPDSGMDAGGPDAAPSDAGGPDADRRDAARPDAGPADAGGPDAGGPDAGLDAGPGDGGGTDAGGGGYQYASSATVSSSYPAGDCAELGSYDESRVVGSPDCADCTDYCAADSTPCSWFPAVTGPAELVARFSPAVVATSLRVHLTYSSPPGDVTEVAVAATDAGPFSVVGPGTAIAGCGVPRGPDDHTLTYSLAGGSAIGAVRVRLADYNTGIDAVGLRP